MQKKIIALAVAALASSAAFAQTNVTVYGVVDMTFDRVSRSSADDVRVTGTAADFQNGAQVAAPYAGDTNFGHNRVSGNSSYIGFKGSEALGNGLTAVFQLEAGVAPDAGSAISLSRDSFAGLATSFGTVVAGQLTGPTRALGAALDVNAGATGIGANSGLIGKLGNNLTNFTTDGVTGSAAPSAATRSQFQASMFDTRWKNAIAYVSPKFAGMTATVAYVANENRADNTSGTAAAVNTSGWDLGLNYANGPIMAGITYNTVKVRNGSAVSDGADIAGQTPATTRPVTYAGIPVAALGNEIKTSDLRIGGSYDFGFLKLNALFDRVKLGSAAIDSDLRQNVYGVGVIVPVGNGRVIGQFYKAGDVKNLAENTGAKLYEIGYVHSLSKRTEVRAVYATIRNNENANYDFGVNAVGNGASAAAGAAGAVTTTGLGSNVSGLQLGLRHSF